VFSLNTSIKIFIYLYIFMFCSYMSAKIFWPNIGRVTLAAVKFNKIVLYLFMLF
jgi:hypothetical protein